MQETRCSWDSPSRIDNDRSSIGFQSISTQSPTTPVDMLGQSTLQLAIPSAELAPLIRHCPVRMELEYVTKMKYHDNTLNIWLAPTQHRADGIRPLAELDAPKYRWLMDGVVAVTVLLARPCAIKFTLNTICPHEAAKLTFKPSRCYCVEPMSIHFVRFTRCDCV
jgi:hypothetical protein